MALIGLATAFLGAVVADLKGNAETRWFSRRGFALLVAIEMGVTASGLASAGGDLLGVLPF